MNTNSTREADFMLGVSRDVFAIATTQVTNGGDPKLLVREFILSQPEHLQLPYAAELARCLTTNLGALLLDMHGSASAARAAIAGGALAFEQAVNMMPPNNDHDGHDGD